MLEDKGKTLVALFIVKYGKCWFELRLQTGDRQRRRQTGEILAMHVIVILSIGRIEVIVTLADLS